VFELMIWSGDQGKWTLKGFLTLLAHGWCVWELLLIITEPHYKFWNILEKEMQWRGRCVTCEVNFLKCFGFSLLLMSKLIIRSVLPISITVYVLHICTLVPYSVSLLPRPSNLSLMF
jgi:hypothetical protein